MPSMSTHSIQVQLPCAEQVFNARTEEDWKQAIQSHPLERPMFSEAVTHLMAEDGDTGGKRVLQPHLDDGLCLMLILHGLMSMSNDMVHFENRSTALGSVEKGESSAWIPWRRRVTEALETWKAKYDAYIMAKAAAAPKESTALLVALYHMAHIVINAETSLATYSLQLERRRSLATLSRHWIGGRVLTV